VLFEADRSWSKTLVDQLATFRRAIIEGAQGSNDLPEQTPTLRFIDRCYAQRRSEGLYEVQP
jgi:hypothetical protein